MADIKVTATVRLHEDDSGYFVDAALQGCRPATGRGACRQGAHDLPYSKAARGNIEVKLLANGKPVGLGYADSASLLRRLR
jgi:hypothetical protein